MFIQILFAYCEAASTISGGRQEEKMQQEENKSKEKDEMRINIKSMTYDNFEVAIGEKGIAI